jgi:hypothetical protein
MAHDMASRLPQTHPRLSDRKIDLLLFKIRRSDWKKPPGKRSKNNESRLLRDTRRESTPLGD